MQGVCVRMERAMVVGKGMHVIDDEIAAEAEGHDCDKVWKVQGGA